MHRLMYFYHCDSATAQDADTGGVNFEARMDSFVLSCVHVIFVFIIIPVFFYQLYIILSLVGFCLDHEKWIMKMEDPMLKAGEVANRTFRQKKSEMAGQRYQSLNRRDQHS
jgi:hypothetical protein